MTGVLSSPQLIAKKQMRNVATLHRRRFLGALAMTFAAAKFGIVGSYALPWMNEGDSPSLRGATGWLNSKLLTLAELHGEVVLGNF
jgi:hypothetical protein